MPNGKNLGGSSRPTIQVFDLARCAAVFSVAFGHFSEQLDFHHTHRFLKEIFHLFQIPGRVGVTVFFVVSGFLISKLFSQYPGGLYKPDFKDFYSRRAARLLPLLILFTLAGVAFIHFGYPSNPSMRLVLADPEVIHPGFWASIFLFYENWDRIFFYMNHPTAWMGQWRVLWTLSVEEQFYLFFPLCLLWLGNGKRLAAFLGFLVLLGPVYRAWANLFYPQNPRLAIEGSFGSFDQIALGILLYLTVEKYGGFFTRRPAFAWRFVAYGAVLLFVVSVFTDCWRPGLDRIIAPTLGGAGVFLFMLGAMHVKFFSMGFLKPLSLPGQWSYGSYLFHPIVLALIPFFSRLHPILIAAVYLAIVLAAAGLSFRFFEVPINRFILKKLRAAFAARK